MPTVAPGVKEVKRLIRQFCIFFVEANTGENGELTCAEFTQALPSAVKEKFSADETFSWFNTIDPDRSGVVRVGEFFRWALAAATLVGGAGITKFFQAYDNEYVHGSTDGGHLDELEFTQAARDLGFGELASLLYQQLPRHPQHGTLDYTVLMEEVQQMRSSRSLIKAFLRAMAWDQTTDVSKLDTSGWSFTAKTADGVRHALVGILKKHRVKLSQIFDHIDTTDDNVRSLPTLSLFLQKHVGACTDASGISFSMQVCERAEFVDSMIDIGFRGSQCAAVFCLTP